MNAADLEPPWTRTRPSEDPASTSRGTTRGPFVNAMTVDVEDYFQVQAFADRISRDQWDGMTWRVERNTDAVLKLFDDFGIRATFFTLGCVAERFPATIRRIVDQGHELASHGYYHIQVHEKTPEEFHADVSRTKAVLEDAGGVAVRGYRAATFSISERTPWAFDVLAKAGYTYSSSVNPIRHDLYGIPDAPRFAYRPDGRSDLVEIPITTIQLGGRRYPCGGGGFFRLLPYAVSSWSRRRVHQKDGQPVVFYFHPWEIDLGQPRIDGLSVRTRLRHYINLNRMESRLRRLMRDFSWDRVDKVFLPGLGAA